MPMAKIVNRLGKNKIPKRYLIPDREIIYLVDFEIDLRLIITKTVSSTTKGVTLKRKYTVRKIQRTIILPDEIWSRNRNKEDEEYFMNELKLKYAKIYPGKFKISRIILKKELSNRFY